MSIRKGGCHCGAVRYSVELAADAEGLACNCSMCGRAGTVLAFVPEASFTLESGADNLGDYQFNKHVIHHHFCKTCGIKSFAKGAGPKGPIVAVNIRCLDDFELGAQKINNVDGKSA